MDGASLASSRRVSRSDTVKDAKFLKFSLETPLVFNQEPITVVEEDIPAEPRQEFPGPQRWEEGYQHELKSEADRILRHFTKTAEGEYEDSPVAPIMEDNLNDRLGRGYLDPTEFTLVSEETAMPLSATTLRRSLAATQFARMTSRIGFHNRVVSRSKVERQRQESKDKVLPSSAHFSPEFYLSHVHVDTSLSELREGMHYLEEELSKRTGQLKTLVKEHFEGFISCKNTIDDVHFRLRRNEMQNSGVNTQSLKASLTTVQTELMNSFSPILERHDKLEQLKHVVEILKRFQSSFNLPSNIRQLSKNSDFQQVVTEYKRAKSVMESAEIPIWRSLFEEVKKEMTDVCMKISQTLNDPGLDADRVQELVICIGQLRSEGLEFALTLEPVMLWLNEVEGFVENQMEKLLLKHHRQIERSMIAPERSRKRTMTMPLSQKPESTSQTCPTQYCLEYIQQMCKLLRQYLPKLWKLKNAPQLMEIPDVDEGIHVEIAKELENVDTITKRILDDFSKNVVETMESMVVTEGLLSPCVFVTLKELRIFGTDMTDCPESCTSMMKDLIQECFEMCVNYLCTFLRQQMASLGEWEDWKICIGSYTRGHPVTGVPYKLGQAVRNVMEQFALIKAEQDQWLDNSCQMESKCLTNAFNECFESFAMAVEGLAAEILEPTEPSNRHNTQMVEISKLLILISNSMYIRQRILPELTDQYFDFIASQDGAMDRTSLLKQFKNLEDTMVRTYVDHAKKLVEKAVDVTIAAEKEMPPLRLTAYRSSEAPAEWMSVIVDIHAEVMKYAPSKCEVVITAMVLHLVKRMRNRIQDLPSLGFLLQMYIDAMFVETVFKGVDVRDVHKAWDAIYDRLNGLIRARIMTMKDPEKCGVVLTEDAGFNVLNAFSDGDVEDVMKLDKKLQRMFKDGVRESIKTMSINLASMRIYKTKDRQKTLQRSRTSE